MSANSITPAELDDGNARGGGTRPPAGTVLVATTRRRRFALIILVIAAASGCLALGWWQWTRYESVSEHFRTLATLYSGRCSLVLHVRVPKVRPLRG